MRFFFKKVVFLSEVGGFESKIEGEICDQRGRKKDL